jgi:hypothetical protein
MVADVRCWDNLGKSYSHENGECILSLPAAVSIAVYGEESQLIGQRCGQVLTDRVASGLTRAEEGKTLLLTVDGREGNGGLAMADAASRRWLTSAERLNLQPTEVFLYAN